MMLSCNSYIDAAAARQPRPIAPLCAKKHLQPGLQTRILPPFVDGGQGGGGADDGQPAAGMLRG